MADNTSRSLRSSFVYQVFVRNYSEAGDFKELTADLERIRALGADIIHLLPIHPIGLKRRKGSLGSPYAIKDYTSIDPAYGREEDLSELLRKAHSLGMRVLMDIVYNHTSPDSRLFSQHPDWFYHKNGVPGNKAGDWQDVIDLDFERGGHALERYLIDNLSRWAKFGFDGFRCDVASLVPVDFWIRARKQVDEAKPGLVWLAESVHGDFIRKLRRLGFRAHSDSELYQAFDVCYDYDTHDRFQEYAYGRAGLRQYLQALRSQEFIYPDNYVKLRYLGNHDFERPAALFEDRRSLEAWTAFTFFNKGTVLIYMGDETLTDHRPDLFEKDVIDLTKQDLRHVGLIKDLASMRISDYFSRSRSFEVSENEEDNIVAVHELEGRRLCGIFNVGKKNAPVDARAAGIRDGEYRPLLGGRAVIANGLASVDAPFSVFECRD